MRTEEVRAEVESRDAAPQRLRITFTKGENLRYISHLDLARTWERVLRRAGIPVAYSRGYHPHPKIVFAAALPVGCTGAAEVMDIVLSQPMPPRRVLRGLGPRLPDGLTAVDATPVYDRAPALPTLLHSAEYESVIATNLSIDEAACQCQALLARESIARVYRNKSYDLRPLVDDLQVLRANARHLMLRMHLAAGERGTGRPDEVLDELGWADFPHTCHRRRLQFCTPPQTCD
jgi:radical SAM-linked protein